MKTQTEIEEEKKLSDKAIQRWENEGGEVPANASVKEKDTDTAKATTK